MYEYRARVTRVVDGDTFHATVELGFHVKVEETFRLVGIDTPEMFRPRNEAEREHGRQAKARVVELIEGREVLIRSEKSGKYGRWLARVVMQDCDHHHYGALADLTDILRAEGFEKREEY